MIERVQRQVSVSETPMYNETGLMQFRFVIKLEYHLDIHEPLGLRGEIRCLGGCKIGSIEGGISKLQSSESKIEVPRDVRNSKSRNMAS